MFACYWVVVEPGDLGVTTQYYVCNTSEATDITEIRGLTIEELETLNGVLFPHVVPAICLWMYTACDMV